ncbi:glycosyltransferase [Leptotrichia buccalis]|uniref:Glycosyl transferase group 1 n=1 Tax=Leptotrichia buccalis (strain ATCC 14201 / DSM 1135 / JCM 12969 / NCTC 10249 / C-1013-b) TaxID=523794 RepID=C7NDZ9_LEPBD|nr:glycosyltransferase [Leptotrichia buccalis]ACV40113.1 glycosyl transferase group 1 [Leptotrichia buccalis C-1013-b]
MKILVLHGHLSMGGEERVLLNVLRNLVELNYDVDLLITWNHKENNLFENEIPKKVNYEFLFDSYNGKNKLIKEIYRIKAKTTYLKKIEKKIKNEKYDIVIDYSSNLLKYDNFDIKIPVFAWIHFSLTFGEKLTLEKIKKYKKQYKKYSKIFAITRVMKEEFINKVGIDEKKVELVYNPIDLKLIEKKAENVEKKYENYLKQDYFLQVSRLTQQKQPEHLVDIYYKLKQAGIKEKLYFIGDDEKKEIIKQKIKEYNLEDDIILLGQIENPYPFFKNAKLFVHTAKYEGLPTVLLESLALGTPVVSYDCPTGPRDILGKNSEYGELISLNDKDMFVEKVLELMNSKEKYEKYKKLSLIRANDFSMENNKVKLKELIENIKK